MKEYTFDQLTIGHKEEFSVTVNEEMIKKFLEITGDVNPLHNDTTFAKSMGFPSRVVYGMLTASMFSTLAGVYLPGKYCLIQQVETKFVRPVFVNDVLTVSGEVSELHESVEQMVMKITIINQNGEKVVKGKMKVGFLHERQ